MFLRNVLMSPKITYTVAVLKVKMYLCDNVAGLYQVCRNSSVIRVKVTTQVYTKPKNLLKSKEM